MIDKLKSLYSNLKTNQELYISYGVNGIKRRTERVKGFDGDAIKCSMININNKLLSLLIEPSYFIKEVVEEGSLL